MKGIQHTTSKLQLNEYYFYNTLILYNIYHHWKPECTESRPPPTIHKTKSGIKVHLTNCTKAAPGMRHRKNFHYSF